ncbi:OmpH family outer membrane protein [Psittacicella hinzii]|uniref:Periplasmic chaperone for outer membrane proteins Skp n=1 Tax=Psittacicella hinzii TaxID=2028575 RepID=A0A3A1YAD9_9GAMM|nr:OmpH family outer membrane protein [Psittacicella hinzii]RIY34635.1 hypothetical protein CKF58_07965 [Psittacicella hinzii]
MQLKKSVLAAFAIGFSSLVGVATVSTAYAAPAASTASVVVAVVNYDSLVQQSKAYADGAKQFDAKFKQRNADLEKLGKELQTENAQIEKMKQALDKDLQSGKLSGAQLKSRETSFQQKAQAFEQKYTNYQMQLQKLQQEMQDFQNVELDRVDKAVRDIVAKYAAQNKITLVVDSRAAIYYANAIDITSQLVKLVQQ